MLALLSAIATRMRRFTGDARGVAAVELAVAAPVLAVMSCGLIDTALYIKIHFDAAATAYTVSDVVSRYQTISSADVAAIFGAASEVIGRETFADGGVIVLSSVARGADEDDAPEVIWQCSGGGALVTDSRIGAVGEEAAVPADMTIEPGDDLIVAEVAVSYEPIFPMFAAVMNDVYKTAVFRPRLGALTAAPGC